MLFCESLSMKYPLADRLRDLLGETLGFLIGNLPNVFVVSLTLGIPPHHTDGTPVTLNGVAVAVPSTRAISWGHCFQSFRAAGLRIENRFNRWQRAITERAMGWSIGFY
jgi:hypothetical protein